MSQPLINGTAYQWSQVEVRILNNQVYGITELNFSQKQEITDNYGAGMWPVSRSYGKMETEASMTLEMAEVEALIDATPDGLLQSIPEFSIVVSWLPKGGKIITKILHNVRIKSNEYKLKQGDERVLCELALACSHISHK